MESLDTELVDPLDPTLYFSGTMIIKLFKPCITSCVICRGKMNPDLSQENYTELMSVPWIYLECDHAYHADCFSRWMKTKSCCPLCNSDYIPIPNKIEKYFGGENGIIDTIDRLDAELVVDI
jgi:hypothetical protein